MIRGQEVKFIVNEDVFGNDLFGLRGIFLKTDPNSKKSLFYVPAIDEWCEMPKDSFKVMLKGRITNKNKDFISRVKTLEVSMEC